MDQAKNGQDDHEHRSHPTDKSKSGGQKIHTTMIAPKMKGEKPNQGYRLKLCLGFGKCRANTKMDGINSVPTIEYLKYQALMNAKKSNCAESPSGKRLLM
jgi:hypothetical protein